MAMSPNDNGDWADRSRANALGSVENFAGTTLYAVDNTALAPVLSALGFATPVSTAWSLLESIALVESHGNPSGVQPDGNGRGLFKAETPV